jgi:hypothetical protein
MSCADLLHTAEREPHDRPVRVAASVPDLEPTSTPWHGPATLHANYWRERALAAEQHVAELQQRLRHYRFTP